MTLRPDECVTCGFPTLRPEGHAEWCAEVAERNRLSAIAADNRLKTHCPQGHAYQGDNLVMYGDGVRRCRTCRTAAKRESYARRQAS